MNTDRYQEFTAPSYDVEVLDRTDKPSNGTISGYEHVGRPIQVSQEVIEKLDTIIHRINIQPFGWDKDEGPTPQDIIDTIQYNLNHGWDPYEEVDKGMITQEQADLIKNSGLFPLHFPPRLKT